MKKNMNNIKLFRNLFCLTFGLGVLAFWNYLFYFGSSFSLMFFAFFLLIFFMSIYKGLILLIFKFELDLQEEEWVFGEGIAMCCAAITLAVMFLYVIFKYIFPPLLAQISSFFNWL